MAGRLTWKVSEWAGCGWVPRLPEVRKRWGDDVGGLTEAYRMLARPRPGMVDIRRTLQAIARAPEAVPWHQLDGQTEALLDAMAWRRHRVMFAHALSPQQLAACAIAAAGELRGCAGRRRTQDLAAQYLQDLRPLLPAPSRRGEAYNKAAAELLVAAGLVLPSKPDVGAMDSVRLLRARATRLRR